VTRHFNSCGLMKEDTLNSEHLLVICTFVDLYFTISHVYLFVDFTCRKHVTHDLDLLLPTVIKII